MRKFLSVFVVSVALCACGKSEPPESADALVSQPERLEKVQQDCKAGRSNVSPETCTAVSDAWRRRFMGNGRPKYTPAN